MICIEAERNEPGSHWCVGAELSQMLTAHSSEPLTSAIGGALDLKQLNNRRLESKAAIFKRELGLGLESASACSPFKRSFLFQYKTSRKRVVTALCCWYSFPFHVILSKPVQSRRLLMWRRVNQPNEHKEDSRWWWDLISIASIREAICAWCAVHQLSVLVKSEYKSLQASMSLFYLDSYVPALTIGQKNPSNPSQECHPNPPFHQQLAQLTPCIIC